MALQRELGVLVRLATPVALTQLGMMMMGVVDTLMVSRLGVDQLAASAVANMWQWTWLSLGLGLVMGVDPLISQAHGRGDGVAAGLGLQRGVVLALLASAPIGMAMLLTEPGLVLLGQDAHISAMAGTYNAYKLPTVPCFLIYSALRQYLQGRTLMAPATWVMWIGNGANVVLNWALVFGHLGAPRLGLIGAALASSLTTFMLVLGLVLWTLHFRLHEAAWHPWSRAALSPRGLYRVARLGLPVGAQISLESAAFAIATLMSGWLGAAQLGSHHIVLSMAALSFMVPLGIAQGASTRVGNLIGRGDEAGMKRAAFLSIGLGASVMVGSALCFTTLRDELPRLYTDDPGVVVLAAQILPIAGAFQLFDGTQAVAGGVLRGMGRPDAGALVNLVGYYVLALPLAYYLGFALDLGLRGIWIGLWLGLTTVAVALVVWVRRTSKEPIEKLRVRAHDSTDAVLPSGMG